ncbi:hypothetical protein AMYX_21530 [Anaeromyxobacter diazotrophicus]|uniref:Response regulatory domain-containing protein n=1 Tax=Anaeromyxobacter diazotrophicus TaxID=2590199 RepID=A0A7I9VLX4_9BACT|nr:hypothetical protein AMYX_21530 [Anaeromyxobacter diazotrophicus]
MDDDAAIRECIAELLSTEGFDVREARDGREGLRALDAAQPGVVVLDLMMPVMSGWEFLEAKKQRRPAVANIPVIVVTASDRPGVETERVLRKPFDLEALLAAVEELTGRAPPPPPGGAAAA